MKTLGLLLSAMLALPTSATTAHADEERGENHPHQKMTLDQLPAAVKATVKREAKGKTIEWIAKEQESGKTVYEVELVANGKGVVLEISEAGKILERKAPHDEKNEREEHEH